MGLIYGQMGRKGLEGIENARPRIAAAIEGLLHEWTQQELDLRSIPWYIRIGRVYRASPEGTDCTRDHECNSGQVRGASGLYRRDGTQRQIPHKQ